MTEDPYRLDDELELSSIDSDFEDEYDGLETAHEHDVKRGIKKMPIVLAMMLTVFVGGAGYIAYQMFVADVTPIAPAQPLMGLAQMPPFSPDNMMPPMDGNADMPPMLDDENAIAAEALLPPPALGGEEQSAGDEFAEVNVDEVNVDDMNGAEIAAIDATDVEEEIDAGAVEEGAVSPDEQVQSVDESLDETIADNSDGTEETTSETVSQEIENSDVAQDAAQESSEIVAVAEDDMVIAQAPAESLLQPIDPVPAIPDPVIAEVDANAASGKVAEPVVTSTISERIVETARTTSAQTRQVVDQQVDEVQKILESVGVEKAPPPANIPPPPVEVTPRAREVIVVTRSYGAQSPQAVQAAGERVLQADQYGAAVEIFDNQLRQNPSDPLALAGKALALQKAGNVTEAMNTYDRLLSLNPRDIEALTNYLGLLQQQDPQQALVRLQGLAQQYPQNAAIAGQLGMLYARTMDTPNAIRQFQTAAALDSTNATYPFNLAVLYDRLGSRDKALQEYRHALGLVRDYPSRADISVDVIRQRLQALSR